MSHSPALTLHLYKLGWSASWDGEPPWCSAGLALTGRLAGTGLALLWAALKTGAQSPGRSLRNSLSNILGLPGATCLGALQGQASAHQSPGGPSQTRALCQHIRWHRHWQPKEPGNLGGVSGFRLNFSSLRLPCAEQEGPLASNSGMQSISYHHLGRGQVPLPALE